MLYFSKYLQIKHFDNFQGLLGEWSKIFFIMLCFTQWKNLSIHAMLKILMLYSYSLKPLLSLPLWKIWNLKNCKQILLGFVAYQLLAKLFKQRKRQSRFPVLCKGLRNWTPSAGSALLQGFLPSILTRRHLQYAHWFLYIYIMFIYIPCVFKRFTSVFDPALL